MDEPLGALDRKLREALQLEIISIRRRLGITVIYVTHDQEEALSMSDRIAVFDDGPHRADRHRATSYTSGPRRASSPTSSATPTILRGRVSMADGQPWLETAGARLALPTAPAEGVVAPGKPAALVVRAERARLEPGPSNERPAVPITAEEVLYLGATVKVVVRLPDGTRGSVRQPAGPTDTTIPSGSRAWMTWQRDDAVLVPDEAREDPPDTRGSEEANRP